MGQCCFGGRRRSVKLFAALISLLAGALPGLAVAAGDCAPDRLDIRGDWGTARFHIELADDAQERAQGLMFREQISTGQGMLFLYQTAHRPAFWMKNTLIALDMLFITPEGRVQHIHENATPGDLTPINGGDGVLAVFEIKGGLARSMGLEAGSEVRFPGFEQSIALWPCSSGN